MTKRKLPVTRIQRIVGEWFMPYNHTITPEDLDYVMDFLLVMLRAKKKYVKLGD